MQRLLNKRPIRSLCVHFLSLARVPCGITIAEGETDSRGSTESSASYRGILSTGFRPALTYQECPGYGVRSANFRHYPDLVLLTCCRTTPPFVRCGTRRWTSVRPTGPLRRPISCGTPTCPIGTTTRYETLQRCRI